MAVEKITAGRVNGIVEDHLAKHRDLYDPRAERMNTVLFGKDGNNGMVSNLQRFEICQDNIDKRLNNIEGYIKWLILLVMGAIAGAVLNMVIR